MCKVAGVLSPVVEGTCWHKSFPLPFLFSNTLLRVKKADSEEAVVGAVMRRAGQNCPHLLIRRSAGKILKRSYFSHFPFLTAAIDPGIFLLYI